MVAPRNLLAVITADAFLYCTAVIGQTKSLLVAG
jgi:hypothetical protein